MNQLPQPQPGDAAPDVTVQAVSGEPFALRQLWRDRPVALFFLRHQGCPFCRGHAATLRDEYSQFQGAGVDVAAIFMGQPDRVAALQAQLKLPYPCLADPQQAAYQAFSAPKGGWGAIAGVQLWAAGARALWKGGLGVPEGDLHQLPASFIVDQDGIVRFAHRAADSADMPDHAQMIAAAH